MSEVELLSPGRTVVVIQRVLPHYRVAFFSRLSYYLRNRGVRLRVLFGQERPGMVPKSVYPDEDWAEFVPNRYWSFSGIELVWQNGFHMLGTPDLVVVEQANRLLVNYLLLGYRALGRTRMAYWGHGRNFQSPDEQNAKEKIKRRIIKAVDWWFAYTRLSADIVSSGGFPRERITVVENSIDTEDLKSAIEFVSPEQSRLVRERLGIGQGPVALFCGGMYPDKHLPFLLEAAVMVHGRIPGFSLILIGSGPDDELVRLASERHPWIHYVGSVYGRERAVYFSVCDVMLMPGLVGLAIIDCFVASLPMITTDVPIHSPEIAYLENNINGVMSAYSLEDYVAVVVDILSDNEQLDRLREGCRASASKYTLDAMVENFATGILACLAT